MLRPPIKKVGNMEEQVGNISRKMKTIEKNQKEMLEIKKYWERNKLVRR